MSEESPLISLRRSAMNLLARREHSYHELQNKLESYNPDLTEYIPPVLDKLRDENLQSDQRFLEAYIRFRRNKGFGPLKIDSELYHKGLDSSDIKTELYQEEHDWVSLCQAALEKRFKVFDLSSQKEKARYQRFLVQRGFSSEEIRQVFNNLS